MYAGTSRSCDAVVQMDKGVSRPPDMRAVSFCQLYVQLPLKWYVVLVHQAVHFVVVSRKDKTE
jgi:hypothetical protein